MCFGVFYDKLQKSIFKEAFITVKTVDKHHVKAIGRASRSWQSGKSQHPNYVFAGLFALSKRQKSK
jgi:hypothetical protein